MSTRCFVCESSLTPCRKKELVLLAALDQALRPRLGRRGQPHRGEGVIKNAAREESASPLRAAAGHPPKERHEAAETVRTVSADRGISAPPVRTPRAPPIRPIATAH